MKDIVKFDNVVFGYDEDSKVLNGLTMSIKEGTYTVLLGHNGSGKSTIAKLIVGLLQPSLGTIEVFDSKLDDNTIYNIRNKVAIVFQNPDNQFIGSTVEDDIAFGLENRCINQADMAYIIEEFSTKVGMNQFLKNEPSALSGGQKQRVAIAGALALYPDLLILDESTSMLDPKGKKEILSVIQNIKKENPKMAILSITHHIDEALLADEIIVINEGRVVQTGKPKDILYNQKLLKDNALLPPFVVEVKDALSKQGIEIDKCFTMEELVDKL